MAHNLSGATSPTGTEQERKRQTVGKNFNPVNVTGREFYSSTAEPRCQEAATQMGRFGGVFSREGK
jgi:hypothetical protein